MIRKSKSYKTTDGLCPSGVPHKISPVGESKWSHHYGAVFLQRDQICVDIRITDPCEERMNGAVNGEILGKISSKGKGGEDEAWLDFFPLPDHVSGQLSSINHINFNSYVHTVTRACPCSENRRKCFFFRRFIITLTGLLALEMSG